MQSPGKHGKHPIKEEEDVRSRKATLERVSRKDLAERKKATQAQRESEEKFRSIFDNANDIIAFVTKTGKILEVNKKIEDILGYKPDELIGKNFMTFGILAAKNAAKIVRIFKEAVKIGGFLASRDGRNITEVWVNHKDGHAVLLEANTTVIRKNGKLIGYLSVIRDITERKKAHDTIRESEERFRTLFDSTREGLMAVDSDGRIVSANPAAATILGYQSPQDLVGMSTAELYADIEQREIVLNELMEKDYVEDFEITVRRKDGTHADLLLSVTIQRDSHGNYICSNGIFRDITERKKAEKRLERQRALLNGINKVLQQALTCETDEDVARTCLAVAEELTGSKLGFIGELNPEGLFDTIAISHPGWDACKMPGSEAVRLIKNMPLRGVDRATLRDGRSRIVNDPSSHPDHLDPPEGHPCITSFLGVPLTHGGKTIGMVGLGNKESGYELADQHNIEVLSVSFVEALMRKRAEVELRASEERFRNIFETAANLIISVDAQGIIVVCNPRISGVLGYTKEEIIGQSMPKIIHPDDHLKAFECLSEILSTGYSYDKEYKMVRKDGEVIDVSIHASGLRDEKGDINRTICIIEDITEQKRAEEQLLKYQARLKAMASQLSSVQERQRRQLAVELHDRITQKMAIAKLGLETAALSLADTDAAKKVNDIAAQIGRTMEDAYSLMLELSNPVLYEIGLIAAVDALLKSDLVKNSGIECRLVAPRQPMKIETDIRVALYQAIRELLVNAMKYSKAKHIEIALQKTSDAATITVKDDGVGFDPSDVKRPGKQGGFGLFNIRENIGALGGELTVESTSGQGTSAIVCVPLPQKDSPKEGRRL